MASIRAHTDNKTGNPYVEEVWAEEEDTYIYNKPVIWFFVNCPEGPIYIFASVAGMALAGFIMNYLGLSPSQ